MDPFSLIENVRWAGVPIAVLAGIVLGATPFAWPVLGVALGSSAATTVADVPARERPVALRTVAWLGLGITVVYASLGLVVGDLDRVVRSFLGAWSGVGYVVLAVLLGAAGAWLIARPAAACRLVCSVPRRTGPAAALIGVPLGIVNCPACAGLITGIALAAAPGGRLYAVIILAALGVGHTLALLGVTKLVVGGWLPVPRDPLTIQRVGGGLLVLTALWFTYQALGTGVAVTTTLP